MRIIIFFLFTFNVFAGELVLNFKTKKKYENEEYSLSDYNNSLCPKGSHCVWAGDITFNIVHKEKKYKVTHYPGTKSDPVKVLDKTFSLKNFSQEKLEATFEVH